MTRTILALISLAFLGCSGNNTSQNSNDSLFSKEREAEIRDSLKKVVDQGITQDLIDTVGLYKSPVKVLSAKLHKREYSNYRDISIKFKNVSNKTISGIKFSWYGVNAFNEPADMGNSVLEGFGGGFTDDELRPGKIHESNWGILSRDGKKVKIAWPHEVAFADGTAWKLPEKN